MTAQQEADYYKSQAKSSMELGKKDKEYLIVSKRFKSKAKYWQDKADKEKKDGNK